MGRTIKKMLRYLRRVKSSLRYISSHPLTKDQAGSAYLRYFTFHFIQLINGNSPRKFTLLENVRYFATISVRLELLEIFILALTTLRKWPFCFTS